MALILGVIFIVAVTILAFVLGSFVSGFLGGFGLGSGGGGTAADECPFMTDGDARDVLGGNADAMELAGIADASIGLVIDKRVLADSPDCWISDGQKAYIARVARSDGNGPAVYAQEKANAQPTSQDQGGGVTIENPGYFAGDVSGLGDEAFCTGISSAIMAGVVVRQGDDVVYASVGPPEEGDTSVPDMSTVGGVISAPGLCAMAQELARKVLE